MSVLIAWEALYRRPEEHPRLSDAERAYIQSDPPDPETRVPWVQLLPHRQTWAFALGKFLTDPIWWFYLYWLPKFLDANFGVKLAGVALPLVAIYLVADVGSVGGGYVSSALIKRDVLVAFRPKHFDKVPDAVKDPQGRHIAQRLNLAGMVVRTDKVDDPPKNWTDLTDPRYKGRMVMPDPSYTAIQLNVVGML